MLGIPRGDSSARIDQIAKLELQRNDVGGVSTKSACIPDDCANVSETVTTRPASHCVERRNSGGLFDVDRSSGGRRDLPINGQRLLVIDVLDGCRLDVGAL